MFTIVNMSKATLCNSLERVTEAVPKVQYSGYRLKLTQCPRRQVPTATSATPWKHHLSKLFTPGPGLKLIKGFLMSSIKTLVPLHQPPLVRHFSY